MEFQAKDDHNGVLLLICDMLIIVRNKKNWLLYDSALLTICAWVQRASSRAKLHLATSWIINLHYQNKTLTTDNLHHWHSATATHALRAPAETPSFA
jgi:hypothetical protein